MGGSGGQRYSDDRQNIEALRREIQDQLRQQELEASLNAFLGEELASFNDRDMHLTEERLTAIEDALNDSALDVDRLLFGGSVAKHTYVDGLSDVDALVVLDDPNATPGELVERFAEVLRGRLESGKVLDVTAGNLAVTVTYRDGSQIQLLPAVERGDHTMIASEDAASWRQIRPHKFAEKLTEVNRSNGNAVVPTVKLAKAAMANLPPEHQLSGYHVEAIAVDAFRNYSGRRDRLSMLKHLVDHAAEAVLRPTGDITGQSVHIDAHLGPADSAERRSISSSLQRLSSRLSSSTRVEDYRVLFDD
jgi:predicted nucleotidyltransferase